MFMVRIPSGMEQVNPSGVSRAMEKQTGARPAGVRGGRAN
jgi:hypothetical protein